MLFLCKKQKGFPYFTGRAFTVFFYLRELLIQSHFFNEDSCYDP